MGEHRIRLPVVEGEHLLGMVGIRDLLGSILERLWQTHDPAAHDTARALFKKQERSEPSGFARSDPLSRIPIIVAGPEPLLRQASPACS